MASEFDDRAAERRPDLDAAPIGPDGPAIGSLGDDVVSRARTAHADRSTGLIALDRRRTTPPDRYQAPVRGVYIASVDRFGGDRSGVRDRISALPWWRDPRQVRWITDDATFAPSPTPSPSPSPTPSPVGPPA